MGVLLVLCRCVCSQGEVCLAVALFPNRRAGSDFENPEVYQQVVILRQMKNCWVTGWNYFPKKTTKKSSSRLSKEKLIDGETKRLLFTVFSFYQVLVYVLCGFPVNLL